MWPAPRAAVAQVAFLLCLAALGAGVTGLVAMLLALRRGGLLGTLGLGGTAVALLGAPALGLLSAAVGRRSEAARRLLRWTLPAAAIFIVWAADEFVGVRLSRLERRWFGGAVAAGVVATWGWVMLGRPDVRAAFEAGGRRPSSARGDAALLASYLLFVIASVGAGAGTLSMPRWFGPGIAELGYILGSLGSGLVTTAGVGLAIALWRGPEAALDLVTPDAWTRIVAQRERPPAEILADLERDQVPPPGRRWTLEVVLAVLRADDPGLTRTRPPG